jgi:hypothetical protein
MSDTHPPELPGPETMAADNAMIPDIDPDKYASQCSRVNAAGLV